MLGKILVVFVAASSLGFVAFVAAMRNGGPDWQGEMRSPELQSEFVFSTDAGEIVKYSATHRRTESTVSSKKPILAEVVIDARKKLEQETNSRINELSPQPQQLEEAIKATKESIAADKLGVEAREQSLSDDFQQTWQLLEAVGDQYSKLTIETQDVLKVGQERREEGHRIANQLAILRNDQFAAVEQKNKLADELVRLEENRQRLQRRQKQLKQQLGEVEY